MSRKRCVDILIGVDEADKVAILWDRLLPLLEGAAALAANLRTDLTAFCKALEK